MRNHVRLCEFSGRAEAVLEFVKEAQIEVNFLVFRTVEWTDGCLRLSASRGIRVPIKYKFGVPVGLARRLRQKSCPNLPAHRSAQT